MRDRDSLHRAGRKVKAGIRDTYLLIREFAWPLIIFITVMICGGLIYYYLANLTGNPVESIPASVYLVLGLTFLESPGNFPDFWALQLFYFLMPIIGIAILARGLADFGRLLFNRRARSKEWEMAVASTFSRHVVLIGLGHLGFRVAKDLHELGEEVVVVELNPKADLFSSAQKMGIPVIHEDGRHVEALEAAGVARARAIALCTQNDNLNMQIAFKARKLNPVIKVVIRIFDDDFSGAVKEQFGFHAMSATGMAAPTFAASAAGVDITRPITIEGQPLSLARLDVHSESKLIGLSVAEIEQGYDVSVVFLSQSGLSDFHPSGSRQLTADDTLAVLAGPTQISRLVSVNRSS